MGVLCVSSSSKNENVLSCFVLFFVFESVFYAYPQLVRVTTGTPIIAFQSFMSEHYSETTNFSDFSELVELVERKIDVLLLDSRERSLTSYRPPSAAAAVRTSTRIPFSPDFLFLIFHFPNIPYSASSYLKTQLGSCLTAHELLRSLSDEMTEVDSRVKISDVGLVGFLHIAKTMLDEHWEIIRQYGLTDSYDVSTLAFGERSISSIPCCLSSLSVAHFSFHDASIID